MGLHTFTWKEYEALSPEHKKHLDKIGGFTITDTIAGKEIGVNIPSKKYSMKDAIYGSNKPSLVVWDNQRVGKIKFSPYNDSYNDLLENSPATKKAIEEKEKKYRIEQAELAFEKTYGKKLGEREKQVYTNLFEDTSKNKYILDYYEKKGDEQKYSLIPFLIGKIAKSFGLLKEEIPNKKGNYRIVDFYDEEIGKANNLKDAIFIFKSKYKYCRDEDCLPFIIEVK